MPTAAEIASFADELLRTQDVPDYPNAINGLQIGTDAQISKVAASVDFSGKTVSGARKAGANLLVVHHGAFWEGLVPVTGKRQQVLGELMTNSIGVYSSHIPLDCHPTLGNNVLLAKKLGLDPTSGFGIFNNISIGVAGESSLRISELLGAANSVAAEHGGRAHATPFGREGEARKVGRWAMCTGAGANTDTVREANERRIQTLIVGEGPHWTAVYAEENDLVLVYIGHYASETLGVQALAAAISEEFSIPWEFIPAPTGT